MLHSYSADTQGPSLLRSLNIVEDVVSLVHSIGRVGEEGSAVLISLPHADCTFGGGTGGIEECDHAVLLTTSFVVEASPPSQGVECVFLEQPTIRIRVRNAGEVSPVCVTLRGDKAFYCSTNDPEGNPVARSIFESVDLVGYTVVGCEMGDRNGKSLRSSGVSSIPLPRLPSKMNDPVVGEEHLIVTHVGNVRRYVPVAVREVSETHCTYDCLKPTERVFFSGGAVFSRGGEFIGIPHCGGELCCCLLVKGIVRHLFYSGLLGLCRLPVQDENPYCAPLVAKGVESARWEGGGEWALVNKVFCPIDVGVDGGHVASVEEFSSRRERWKLEPPLQIHSVVTDDELWNEWKTNYTSLILLLHGFPHRRSVVIRAILELAAHEHRESLEYVAEYGGVGILMELCDAYQEDVEVVRHIVMLLGRISLFERNQAALERCDGIAVVLSAMRSHFGSREIQQWGIYTLLNLCRENAHAVRNVSNALEGDLLNHLLAVLRRYEDVPHIVKWGRSLLGFDGEPHDGPVSPHSFSQPHV